MLPYQFKSGPVFISAARESEKVQPFEGVPCLVFQKLCQEDSGVFSRLYTPSYLNGN